MSKKKTGVLVAIILGVLMLVLPDGDRFRYLVSPEKMGALVDENRGFITAQALEQRLKNSDPKLKIYDIRGMKAFDRGSIKGAEHMPVKLLLTRRIIEKRIHKNRLNILVCGDGSKAIQSWMILHAGGITSYALKGGFENWKNTVSDIALYDRMDPDELKKTTVVKKEKYIKPKKKIIQPAVSSYDDEGC